MTVLQAAVSHLPEKPRRVGRAGCVGNRSHCGGPRNGGSHGRRRGAHLPNSIRGNRRERTGSGSVADGRQSPRTLPTTDGIPGASRRRLRIHVRIRPNWTDECKAGLWHSSSIERAGSVGADKAKSGATFAGRPATSCSHSPERSPQRLPKLLPLPTTYFRLQQLRLQVVRGTRDSLEALHRPEQGWVE